MTSVGVSRKPEPSMNDKKQTVIARARKLGRIVRVGEPPRFTEVERLCRKVDAASIFQLKRWVNRLTQSGQLLALQFNKWCALGKVPGHFPGLKSLDTVSQVLDHARKVAHARTIRRNPIGTGGIPRRLVGVSC